MQKWHTMQIIKIWETRWDSQQGAHSMQDTKSASRTDMRAVVRKYGMSRRTVYNIVHTQKNLIYDNNEE